MLFESRNPYNNNLISSFSCFTEEKLNDCLIKADKNYLLWKKTDFAFRSKCLLKLREEILADKENCALLITEEMGKPISEAIAEVEKCALLCTYYAKEGAAFLKNEAVYDAEGKKTAELRFDPLGVIFQIMPWNFPFWQVFRCTVPTLMAGNSTILKHAPNVPRTALKIESLFNKAGFPPGLFQSVFASNEQIAKLLESDIIKGVALTGSLRAGTAVGAVAGKYLKPLVLELGGSDAYIICKDADLEEAVDNAIRSRLLNNGQTCIAAKRFIVEASIYEQFVEKLINGISKLVIGVPTNNNTHISVMARRDLAIELQAQVDASLKLGARVLMEGGLVEGSNCFKPIVIDGIRPEMPAYGEELFGPVFSLFSFNTLEEAKQLANDTPFGLAASVWSKNEEALHFFASNLEVGTVAINQMVKSHPHIPFGGTKKSGLGRELGQMGIRAFVNIKSVVYL